MARPWNEVTDYKEEGAKSAKEPLGIADFSFGYTEFRAELSEERKAKSSSQRIVDCHADHGTEACTGKGKSILHTSFCNSISDEHH